MPDTYTIKRGATRPALRYSAGVDLTGATARFVMADRPGAVPVVDAPAEVAGEDLIYRWAATDTLTARAYYAEFHVTFLSGGVQVFPTDAYLAVEIMADLGGTAAGPSEPSAITGSGSAIEDGDTATGNGTAPITGIGAAVEGADTATGAGSVANVAPAVTTQPSITGNATTGSVLTLAEGAASGTPAPTGAIQWLRGTTAISGATGATYTLVSGDVGQAISARVMWTNSAGSVSATSNAITGQAAPTATAIGGTALGTMGAAGTIYEGYRLAGGDDFDAQPSRWSGRNLTGRYAHSALSYGFRGTNAAQDRALYIDPDFRGNRSQSPVNLGYDGVSVANGIATLTATPTPAELLPYLPQTYTNWRGDAQNRPRLISGSLKTAPSYMISAQADFVVECRVRLQEGLVSGYWPSFWTSTFFWADMGEIDVLEAKKDSTGATRTLMNYIVNAADGSFQSMTVNQPAIPAGRWVRLAAKRQGGTLTFYDDIASEGTMALRATTTAHVAQMRGAHDIRLDLAVSQEWDGNTFDISHYPASVEFDFWRAWVPVTAAHGNDATLVLPAINATPGGSWDATLPPQADLYGAGSGLEQVTAAWDNHDAPGMPTRNGTTKLPTSMTVNLAARTVSGTIPATEGGAMPLMLTYAYDDGSPVRRVMLPYYIAPAVQSLPSGWSLKQGDAVDITIPYTAFHSGNLGPHTYNVTAPGLTVTGNGTTEVRITGTAGETAQITIEAENIRGQKTSVQRTLAVAVPPPSINGFAYETWTGPAWFDLSDDSTLTRSGTQINAIANKRAGGGDLVGGGTAANRTVVPTAQNGRQALRITRVPDGDQTMPRFEALATDPLSQAFQGDDKPRTTITVYKPLGTDTGFIWSASAGTSATEAQNVALVRRNTNASIRRQATGSVTNDVSWGAGQAGGVARIVAERHSGTTVTVWDNSLTKVVTDAAQNTGPLNATLRFALGVTRSTTTTYAGTQASAEYYEFICENRVVPDADVQQAITDLAAKWGITLT